MCSSKRDQQWSSETLGFAPRGKRLFLKPACLATLMRSKSTKNGILYGPAKAANVVGLPFQRLKWAKTAFAFHGLVKRLMDASKTSWPTSSTQLKQLLKHTVLVKITLPVLYANLWKCRKWNDCPRSCLIWFFCHTSWSLWFPEVFSW